MKSSGNTACVVDRRIRDRSTTSVCQEIAQAIEAGNKDVIRSSRGTGLERAVRRMIAADRREATR